MLLPLVYSTAKTDGSAGPCGERPGAGGYRAGHGAGTGAGNGRNADDTFNISDSFSCVIPFFSRSNANFSPVVIFSPIISFY